MADSIWGKILEKTRDEIKCLTLEGFDALTKLVILETPRTEEGGIPAVPFIFIAPFQAEEINESEGTNASDDITYPLLVAIVDSKQTILGDFDKLDQRLFWRETIIDHFIHNTQIDMHPNRGYDIEVRPLPAVDGGAWFGKQTYVSPLSLRYKVQKLRRQT